MEELAPGDVVFRMLDDVGVAATVRSVDVSARTLCVTFNDGGGEESDVDFDEIELEDPAALALPLPHAASELQVEQKESEYSHEDHGNGAGDAPPLPRAFGEAPDIPDYPADSEDSPSLPAPAKAVSEADSQPPPSEQKEKPLTLTQMMAQLSARVESFAQQQEDLKHAFQKAHDERNVLTEEVRRSKEQVEIQEANRNRAAREYQLADMQLKRASADVEMALKKAVPFLTGAKPDFALLDYAGSGSSRFAGFPTIEEGGGTGAGGGGAKKYHGASPPGARAAIVTTVRYAAADVIAAFCRWHLFKGFVHIYLFFEDPQEAFRFKQYLRAKLTPVAQATEDGLSHAWMAILSGESVSIIVTDVVDVARADPVYLSEKRESSFMKTPEAGSLDTEIMARQCLNAEVAAARAATHPSHSGGRMDWLLHIDIDELFLVQAADPMEQQPTVSQHFSSVPAEVQFVAYVNHEAVPEHDGDIRNYFTEVCLFKQNPNVFKRRPQEVRLAFLAFRKLAALMRRLSKALPQSQVASNCRKCLETIPQVERPGSSGPSAQRASCSRTKRVCQSISRACTFSPTRMESRRCVYIDQVRVQVRPLCFPGHTQCIVGEDRRSWALTGSRRKRVCCITPNVVLPLSSANFNC
eukprot:INCI8308.3.p1 GENE.INCI8308.3~~INCI8308.3.p1  ORF type:complete len:639 (+),score=110.00 INCI8308.3:238-2154(+)